MKQVLPWCPFQLSVQIILTFATKIKKTDEEFQQYLFNLGELSRFLGLTTNADYSYLQEVTKNLLSKVLTLEVVNAHKERQKQTKKEKEDIEHARVFQQSLSAEGMEN